MIWRKVRQSNHVMRHCCPHSRGTCIVGIVCGHHLWQSTGSLPSPPLTHSLNCFCSPTRNWWQRQIVTIIIIVISRMAPPECGWPRGSSNFSIFQVISSGQFDFVPEKEWQIMKIFLSLSHPPGEWFLLPSPTPLIPNKHVKRLHGHCWMAGACQPLLPCPPGSSAATAGQKLFQIVRFT